MGIRFLRHIERTTVLAILVDVLDEEPDLTISTLLNELKNHNEKLLDRPRVIVFTKSDLLAPDSKMEKLINGEEVLFISSVSGKGISKLISTLSKLCHN